MRVLALLIWFTAIHSADMTWIRDPGPDIVMKCNHGTDMQVAAVNGKLEINPRGNLPAVDEVAKGFEGAHHIRLGPLDVIGIDKGEFGGGLGFVKGKQLELIVTDNVQGFVTVEQQIFALTGLAHLGSQTGKVWHCREDNGQMKVRLISMLPGTPYTWITHKNSLLILTSSALVSFSTDLEGSFDEMSVHNCDGFWSALYPNSMVQIGDDFYVGARSCVLRFSKPKEGKRTVIELGQVK